MSCSNVCAGAPLLTEANWASGSDVVSANRFESTNSSRSVCPEPISWIILGSATVARDAGVGETPGIRHVMGLPLVDRKPDRFLQVHADGGEYLQPCTAVALPLDDIETDRHLTGCKLAGDRGPAMHLCTARLEAEFSPVSISDVLYLSLPAGRNCRSVATRRAGWMQRLRPPPGRAAAKENAAQSRCWLRFGAM